MSSAPAIGERRSIAAYNVAGLPSQSLSRAEASCSPTCAHSPHPVSPERVFTRSTVYRLPETGSRMGNQRISAMKCSATEGRAAAACGANPAARRALRRLMVGLIASRYITPRAPALRRPWPAARQSAASSSSSLPRRATASKHRPALLGNDHLSAEPLSCLLALHVAEHRSELYFGPISPALWVPAVLIGAEALVSVRVVLIQHRNRSTPCGRPSASERVRHCASMARFLRFGAFEAA